ncbi:hypothetical protein [Companilactobacillus baiquanensis]|uniref:DUF4352 domain-containing protein n=1 Tax=Companilactobacillus baiquanensis TaxID=2486005 RepID=A0ABW1UR43_9LACO|nr:hypothetical protein [Companilactobacillus baiquanensis]
MKKIFKILSLLLLLFLVGCSVEPSSESNTKKQAVNYQSLSRHDRRDVSFQFHKSKTTYNYAVNMTVKNNSSRDIRFYLTKFAILNSNNPDVKVDSDSKKIIVVEPNSEVTVRNLFEHVSSALFNGPSGYYYLNSNYLLANLK